MSGFCSLDGKTALVTGASRGIGRAIAVELASAGATVVVGYRSGQDEAEEVAKEIGGRAVQADVSDAASAIALVEAAGDIDILVNNAGLTRDGLLARMSDDDWRTVIDTNLSSVFYTCRAVTRPMMKKRAGAIVNVSSIVGVHGNWGQTNYAASKAGIIGFTKSLAKELGSRNVRANVVAPGYVADAADRRPAGGGDGGDAAADAARPARRSGGRCRRRSLSLLRRGLVRDGRSLARRRRPRDVAWMPVSSDNGRRRIVVTGIGAVTSLGNTFEETWEGLIAGRSGAGPITQFDTTGYPVHFACEVQDLEVTDYVDYKASRRMDRFTHLALAAARQAEADSGLDDRADRRSCRCRRRDRDRRPEVVRAVRQPAQRARARPRQPVLDRADHPESRRRLGLDRARHARAAALAVHRLRRVQHGDRRRHGRDSPRPRRRDDLRRHRGAGDERQHRRLRRHARDLAAQRRSGARLPPVRRRARRLRDG